MYARFPELILIDATYKPNNLHMPMYILMVVDGNRESEIVALWLVVYEDKDTISHLMDIFEKHNDTTNTTWAVEGGLGVLEHPQILSEGCLAPLSTNYYVTETT